MSPEYRSDLPRKFVSLQYLHGALLVDRERSLIGCGRRVGRQAGMALCSGVLVDDHAIFEEEGSSTQNTGLLALVEFLS